MAGPHLCGGYDVDDRGGIDAVGVIQSDPVRHPATPVVTVHGETLRQQIRDGVPHDMSLRISVQQEQPWSLPGDPDETAPPCGLQGVLPGAVEHHFAASAARRKLLAWSTAARVARVSVSELRSMKSWTVPS